MQEVETGAGKKQEFRNATQACRAGVRKTKTQAVTSKAHQGQLKGTSATLLRKD